MPSKRTGTPAWVRLGEMLAARRAELDPAYSGHGGRSAFARERGINLKLVQDIENNDRENFGAVTLRDVIAPAYKVTPESVFAALEGGDLVAAGVASSSRFAGLSSDATDPRKWVPSVPRDLAPWFSEAFAEVAREYDRAAERYPDPSGAQVFSSIDEARAWDDMGSIMAGDAPLSAEQKIVWMAWNRAAYRRAAGEEPGGNRARAAGLIPDSVPV